MTIYNATIPTSLREANWHAHLAAKKMHSLPTVSAPFVIRLNGAGILTTLKPFKFVFVATLNAAESEIKDAFNNRVWESMMHGSQN
jgi:hypothetical protein